jgi:hypothetical protein
MAELESLAELLHTRNQINVDIAKIIGRPAVIQHIGAYIASTLFNITLEYSAAIKGIDGVFTEGRLKGKTVNIKLYGKQEGVLDVSLDNLVEYYLVLTGPRSHAPSSRGRSRPLVITNVYLFEMHGLVDILRRRGVNIGIATSVIKLLWTSAEIFPNQINEALKVTNEQRRSLTLFGP